MHKATQNYAAAADLLTVYGQLRHWQFLHRLLQKITKLKYM